MAETSARNVADFIIAFSHEHGDPVSNLKLQKLLYYAQAWYLALFDKALFDERIEAWIHGPVVPSVYAQFRQWAWQPIECDAQSPEFDQAVKAHLNEVMDVYGQMSAYSLERLTHEEEPWKNARNGLAPDEASHAVISPDDMKRYYRARLNG